MPHFSSYAQANLWFESVPGKRMDGRSYQVDSVGLWGYLARDEDGSIGFYRSSKELTGVVCRPDNTVTIERATSDKDYYNYARRWMQVAMMHMLGVKCVNRYSALWMPCTTDHYGGMGYVPVEGQASLTFVMPDGDNYHPHCTNPVFRTVKHVDRAGKAKLMAPFKDFISYGKGMLKIRPKEPLTHHEVVNILGFTPSDAERYSMLRTQVGFQDIMDGMLSDDLSFRLKTLYRLVLAGSNNLQGGRWGTNEPNPQACFNDALVAMFVRHCPDTMLKEVTPTTGKLIQHRFI
jgi:hypothetical protein